MKPVLIILFITISFFGNSQNGQIAAHLSSTNPLYNTSGLHIVLKKGYMVMNETKTDGEGKFHINSISPGWYTLVIDHIGYRWEFTMDSIKMVKDSTLQLEIDYPGLCRFVYENEKNPKCKEGHTDNIIPIVYGKPLRETVQKAEKGLIYLGGCMVTDRDPHYYCTIHKRKL
jgi:hypothetical protein